MPLPLDEEEDGAFIPMEDEDDDMLPPRQHDGDTTDDEFTAPAPGNRSGRLFTFRPKSPQLDTWKMLQLSYHGDERVRASRGTQVHHVVDDAASSGTACTRPWRAGPRPST